MAEQVMMEKLLAVLNKIDGRLAQIERNTSSSDMLSPADKGKAISADPAPSAVLVEFSPEPTISPRRTEPQAIEVFRADSGDQDREEKGVVSIRSGEAGSPASDEAFTSDNRPPSKKNAEDLRMKGHHAYLSWKPPSWEEYSRLAYMSRDWDSPLWEGYRQTSYMPREYFGQDAKALWTEYIDQMWSVPPDNRIALSFQGYILEMCPKAEVTMRLKCISSWLNRIPFFFIQDFDNDGGTSIYMYRHSPDSSDLSPDDLAQGRSFVSISEEPKDASTSDDTPLGSPWRRLMFVMGLTASLKDAYPLPSNPNHGEPNPNAPMLAKFSFAYIEPFPYLELIIDLHTQPAFANPDEIAWAIDSTMSFHIVYYKIFEDGEIPGKNSENCYLKNERWPVGNLYESKGLIIQGSMSIYATFESLEPKFWPEYWTILFLQPIFQVVAPTSIKDKHVQNSVLYIISQVMDEVISGWGELVLFFDKFLDDGKIFMNPNQHDALLVDDETFSRSRKYFWALSTLAEFDLCIDDAIHQWKSSRAIWEKRLPTFDPPKWPEAEEQMKEIDGQVDRLVEYKERLEGHRKRTSGLRDGLFNASGVMESRASTKLGENVKLLTFVSIFFLPLGFCTSLWSISNDLFSMNMFILVIIIVAFVTYTVVFNLNSIVHISSGIYDRLKQSMMNRMKTDKSPYWKQRGKQFQDAFDFRPKSKAVKPSEWLVGLYFLRGVPGDIARGFKAVKGIVGRGRNGDVEQRGDEIEL